MNTQTQTDNIVLKINNIEVIYDHVILVLKGVSLEVPEGGIVALLGANGAGKTTTIKSISNILGTERGEVTKGSIVYMGEKVENLSPTELVHKGVVQVMEGRHCFEHLTVEENLLTGAYTRKEGRKVIRRRTGKGVQLFSTAETSQKKSGRLYLGRGAADDCCRPSAYGQAEIDFAG